MKFIPKIIPKKDKKHSRFVVLDIGLGRVNIAIFDVTPEGPKFVGVGRRSFGEADTILDATLEATDALGAIVDELPEVAIVGVSGGKLDTVATVAKYNREKPKQPITKEEIASVIHKVSTEEEKTMKVFFSTVTGAKIDGAKVTNPIGVKGEKVEINCFVAYKPEEELAVYEQIIEELELKPERIMPTAFAVSQMVAKNISPNSLVLRIGLAKTEASQIFDSHLIKVNNFDIGAGQIDFLNYGIESILERQDVSERSDSIWVYTDSDECSIDELEKKLKEEKWKEKLKLDKDIKIEIAQSEQNFGPADSGLLALSLQEIFG